MSAQLRDTAGELAGLLWREHTVYRERSGGVVIRAAHVERWISLSPTGGRDQVLIRAGRILEGGTTAPARSETVASLTAGTGQLALICRQLLAETTPGPAPRPARKRRPGRTKKKAKAARRGRHTGFVSWLVILAIAAAVAVFLRDLPATP
ncbi:hypothetical protein ACFYM2_10590 [Streptomyces sp. NPDC006711]|uniref:hypothetical protein n=1 Tax=unclassified Streptomyces TaxID=2593676 RepID=UPI0033DE5E87